jgi:RHS repeat-associated protein
MLRIRRSTQVRALSALLSASLWWLVSSPAPAEAAQRRVLFYHPDHLGSTHLVTDAAGQVVQRTEYRPFGAVSVTTGPTQLAHTYTGQRADASTGLLFYNARYYDPQLGRFTAADDLGSSQVPQSLNRYSYVQNNPINSTDPSGHFSFFKFPRSVFGWDYLIDRLRPSPPVSPGGQRTIQGEINTASAWTVDTLGIDAVYASAAIAAAPHLMMGNITTAAIVFGAAVAAHELRDTGEGRQLTRRIAQEFFDDVVGMSPRAAYVASAVVIETAAALTLETVGAVALYGPPREVRPAGPADTVENPGGTYPYGRYPGDGSPANDPSFETFIVGDNKAAFGRGPIREGIFKRLPLPAVHTAASIPGGGGMQVIPGGWYVYGSYGVCHTASNLTFLQAGVSNTALTASPGWSTVASTLVYGNYGGHAIVATGTGVSAYDQFSP